MTKCRKCGKDIEFIKLKSGKWNPVNPYLRSIKRGEGKETLITMDGEIIKGVFTSMDDGADGVGYISHFATCSHAEEFRKAGK